MTATTVVQELVRLTVTTLLNNPELSRKCSCVVVGWRRVSSRKLCLESGNSQSWALTTSVFFYPEKRKSWSPSNVNLSLLD